MVAVMVDDTQDLARDVSEAERLARRLDKPMGGLGVVFVLVVLGQTIAEGDVVVRVLAVAGWVLWSTFVAELALRAYVAKDQKRFWARNWWQLVFLAVPFLRFVRAFTFLRFVRVSSVVSAAVRGSRSTRRLLTGRIAWLGVVTAVVVLASSQLLYLAGLYDSYGEALSDAAMATVTGDALAPDSGFTRVLEVVLAIYSVAVFATLAAAVGAFYLEPGRAPASTTSAVDR